MRSKFSFCDDQNVSWRGDFGERLFAGQGHFLIQVLFHVRESHSGKLDLWHMTYGTCRNLRFLLPFGSVSDMSSVH